MHFFFADDVDRVHGLLPDDCPMKHLLPADLSFTSTPFGSMPTGSPLSYQLKSRTQNPPSSAKKQPPTPDTTQKRHVFPSLPMSSRQDYCDPKGSTHPVSLKDAQALEQRTVGQAACDEWKAVHQYTLTASNFRRICHSSAGKDTLLKSLFDGGDITNLPAIQHGKAKEPVALSR